MTARRVFLGIGLWLVAAAPADAICEQIEPPTRAERFEERVRINQAFRRDNGMPAGRAHVVRVLRSEVKRVRFGYVLTPREYRFFGRRLRVPQSAGWARIERYTGRHPASFGGLSIGSDFPRGGAAVVRFTRDVARHRRALRELASFKVKVRRVDHSYRQLRRAQRQVDLERLERAGISVREIGTDIDRSRVALGVITKRRDAQRVVRQRLGAIYTVDVIAREATRLVCTPVERARVGGDARTVKLQYFTNSVYEFVRVFLVEEPDRVRVAIVERAPNGPVTQAGADREAEAVLTEPLGGRPLVDALTGKPLGD